MEEVKTLAAYADHGWQGFIDTPYPLELALEYVEDVPAKFRCKPDKPCQVSNQSLINVQVRNVPKK